MGYFTDQTVWRPPKEPKEPKVLKRQPKKADHQAVIPIRTAGGNTVDICANQNCRHIITKLITDQTKCQCCIQGHPAGGPA